MTVNAVNELGGQCVDLAAAIDRVDMFRGGAADGSFSDNARYTMSYWQNDASVWDIGGVGVWSKSTGGALVSQQVHKTDHSEIVEHVRAEIGTALNQVTQEPPCSASPTSNCVLYLTDCAPRFNAFRPARSLPGMLP